MSSLDHNYCKQKRVSHAFVEVQLTGQVHISAAFRMDGFLHKANIWSVESLSSVLDPHVMSEK